MRSSRLLTLPLSYCSRETSDALQETPQWESVSIIDPMRRRGSADLSLYNPSRYASWADLREAVTYQSSRSGSEEEEEEEEEEKEKEVEEEVVEEAGIEDRVVGQTPVSIESVDKFGELDSSDIGGENKEGEEEGTGSAEAGAESEEAGQANPVVVSRKWSYVVKGSASCICLVCSFGGEGECLHDTHTCLCPSFLFSFSSAGTAWWVKREKRIGGWRPYPRQRVAWFCLLHTLVILGMFVWSMVDSTHGVQFHDLAGTGVNPAIGPSKSVLLEAGAWSRDAVRGDGCVRVVVVAVGVVDSGCREKRVT
jgi:hypothetical protein